MTFCKGPKSVNGSYGLTRLPFKDRITLTYCPDVDFAMWISIGGIPGRLPFGCSRQVTLHFQLLKMLGEVFGPELIVVSA